MSLFDFKNLHYAYLCCRKNKRNTFHAVKFEANFESQLLELERRLKSKTYRPERSICFAVNEPVLREIFAASFKDRVMHHLLYNFLEPIFEPKFIDYSYACRQSKGVHLAVSNLKRNLCKATKNYTKSTFILKLDIKSFFMSLQKDILFSIISRHIKNPEALWLSKVIIYNDPTSNFIKKGDLALFDNLPLHKSLFGSDNNQGLPIGNLTSQFFANVYLNELDQFVKHQLKAKYYMRYMDDFLLLSNSGSELVRWRNQIANFLKSNLGLELNHQKQVLQNTKEGIDWLGYIINPDYVLVRKRIIVSLKTKLYNFNKTNFEVWSDEAKQEFLSKVLSVVNSYYGYFKHANTSRLRQKLYLSNFGALKEYLEPKDKYFSSFCLKKKI